MRNISTPIVNAALGKVRKINARAVFKDDRLKFGAYANATANDDFLRMSQTNNMNGWEHHFATSYDGGILRFATQTKDALGEERQLVYQWAPDPDQEWPAWSTISGFPDVWHKILPGAYGNMIWYGKTSLLRKALEVAYLDPSSGTATTYLVDIYILDADGDTFQSGWAGAPQYKLCPISETECYIFEVWGDDTKKYHIKIKMATIDPVTRALAGTVNYDKMVRCDRVDISSFHVVTDGETDHIFFSVDDGRRAHHARVTSDGKLLSDFDDIFPLDYEDDITKFTIGSAAEIGGSIIASGKLSRSQSSQPVQIYTIGPDHFTAGRDMIIGDYGIENFQVGGYVYRAGHGSMIECGDYVYYIVPGATARATKPSWLGGTASPLTYQCNNLKISEDHTGAASVSFDVESSLDTSIKAGMTVVPEIYLSNTDGVGGWFSLYECEIDAIQRTNLGKTSIVARPKGIKRLSQWRSDASYDYWSHASEISTAADMTKNIRMHNLEQDPGIPNAVKPKDNQEIALAWNVLQPARSYMSRLSIQVTGTGGLLYGGPGLNVYTQTKVEAAEALEVPIEDLGEESVRTAGIALLYKTASTTSAAGFMLVRFMRDSRAWEDDRTYSDPLIAFNAVSLAAGTYDLMIVYTEGVIRTYYKAAGLTANWSEAIPPTTFDKRTSVYFLSPTWRTDQRGRACFIGSKGVLTTTASGGITPYVLKPADMDAITGETIYFTPPVIASGTSRSSARVRNSTLALSRNLSSGEFPVYRVAHTPQLTFGPGSTMYASQPWYNGNKASITPTDPMWQDWIWLEAISGGVPSSKTAVNSYKYCSLVLNNGDQAIGVPWEIDQFDYYAPWCRAPLSFNPSDVQYPPWLYYNNDPATGNPIGTWAPNLIPYYTYAGASPWSWDVLYYAAHFSRVHLKELRVSGMTLPQLVGRLFEPNEPGTADEITASIVPSIALERQSWLWSSYFYNAPISSSNSASEPIFYSLHAASGDREITFDFMAKEICRKAGVLSVGSTSKMTSVLLSGNQLAHVTNTQQEIEGSATIKFKLPPDGSTLGVCKIDSGGILGGSWSALAGIDARIDKANGIIYITHRLASEPLMLTGSYRERVSWKYPGSSSDTEGAWVTIAVSNTYLSIWINDCFVCSIDSSVQANSVAFYGPDTLPPSVDVVWPDLDMRVDNFVLDIGQTGLDLIRRLIKRKRIRMRNQSDGGIEFIRDGDEINSSLTPYSLSVATNHTETDINRITRIRLEGVDVYEVLSSEIADYGNVFAVENFDELETQAQLAKEGDLYIQDLQREGRAREYSGAADPRIQPWDTLWVTDQGQAKHVLVKSVKYDLSISEDMAVFDMTLEAEEIL